MRVAHVHRIAGIGGSERHLLTLLPALREGGVDAVFVGFDVPGSEPQPFYDALEAAGVPYRRVPVRGLRRALRAVRPDVVHTHLVHADVYGALAAGRTPVVSTKHNDDPFRTGPFRVVERALARRAAAVVTITDALRRFNVERVGLPAAKVETIHYGLDAVPAAWRAEDLAAPSGRLLVGIGRLVPQKGYETAVRALPAIRAAHPDAVLVLLGEGPERTALETLAAELGVAEALHLPGRTGDVGAWLGRAEVFVHPARWEGFGLVVLEAMLAARPIVASRVSSLPELLEDGRSGLLVEAGDESALADAVVSLLADPAHAAELGHAARARAQEAFSVARMADATAALYRRVAAASSPSAHDSTV